VSPSPEAYARAKELGFAPMTQARVEAEVDAAIRRRERAAARAGEARARSRATVRRELSALERKLEGVERTLAEVDRRRAEKLVERAIDRGAIDRSLRAKAVRLFAQDLDLAREFESGLPANESIAELNRHDEVWDEADVRRETAARLGIPESEVI
jgi:hypothetical protein